MNQAVNEHLIRQHLAEYLESLTLDRLVRACGQSLPTDDDGAFDVESSSYKRWAKAVEKVQARLDQV